MAKKDKQAKALRRKRRKEKDSKHKSKNVSHVYKSFTENAPLYGCWVNQDWQTAGLAKLIVARKMATGLLMFAIFLIDMTKARVENCYGAANFTEEAFQRHVLAKDKEQGWDFFSSKLELVKEILAGVVTRQAKENTMPSEYSSCIKLVGSLEDYLQETLADSNPEAKALTLSYRCNDTEIAETELRQLPMLKELDDSIPLHRRFDWWEEQRRGLFKKKGPAIKLGRVILQTGDNLLQVEATDEKNLQYLNDSLLQYLGTSIVLKE